MSLVKIVNPPPIAYDVGYWSMHVSAALLCMHDHPGLESNPRHLFGQGWRTWSLSDYRGHAHPAAFRKILQPITNWGAQYLMADLLNRDSLRIIPQLLEAITEALGKRFISSQPDSIECYVSGCDSDSGAAFLRSCSARVLTDRRRTVRSVRNQVEDTDLCLLLRCGGDRPIAIFGEVEGVHGERLRRASFWSIKSSYAHFGIGVLPGYAAGPSFEVVDLANFGRRAVLLFGTQNNVMADFSDALNLLEWMFQNGPAAASSRLLPPGMREVADLLASSWSRPVMEVLQLLNPKVVQAYVETMSQEPELSIITTPTIFTA